MRALVLGGTAFIGPAVVKALEEKDFEVTLFNRGRRRPASAGAAFIEGDRRRIADSRGALRAAKPDVVVDMIAFTEADALSAIDVFSGFAGGLVAASSIDVFAAYGRLNRLEDGAPDPSLLVEDSPLRSRLCPFRGPEPRAAEDPARWVDDYEKILVERAYLGQDSFPARIVRLPMVYGPGDYQHRMFEHLKRMDDGRPAILLGRSEASWRTTRGYVADVAAAIALAASSIRGPNRVFNAGERSARSLAEWVQAMGAAACWKGRIIEICDDELPRRSGEAMDWRHDLCADTSRIRCELGFAEPADSAEAMLCTVLWERANPPGRIDKAAFDYAAEDAVIARLAGCSEPGGI